MIDNPLAALGPIAWESVDHTDLDGFLSETFACAQIIADSVPTTTPAAAATTSTAGRPRSQTDGAVSYNPGMIRGWGGGAATPPSATSKDDGLPGAHAKKLDALRQSWKEVKTGTNARDVVVYKMNGGREGYAGSSWFARRSLHKRAGDAAVDVDFDTFKRGLLYEFDLDVPRGKNPTPVRTMVTRKCLENHTAHERAEADRAAAERALQIYLLEADFPGPTASRDFVTMLLTAQSTLPGMTGPCRQFMMVSKPCQHPETPPRAGFVRAQYESVELIREVPIPKAEAQALPNGAGGRRTRSSIDLARTSMDDDSQGHAGHADTHEMAIEWIMITRNNPGGNVPRFLVDRSTPSSIISDANKFLDWLLAQDWAHGSATTGTGDKGKGRAGDAPSAALHGGVDTVIHEEEETLPTPVPAPASVTQSMESDVPSLRGGAESSTRLFNMLAGALGGASTTVTTKLATSFEDAVQVFCPEGGIASVPVHDAKDASEVGDSDLDDDLSDDTGGDSYSDVDESVESAVDGAAEVPAPVPVPASVPAASAPAATAIVAPPLGSAAAAVASPSAITAAALSTGFGTADNSLTSTSEHDNDGTSTSSKAKDEHDPERRSREMDKKERQALKLLEKHKKAVARREAQFQKELQKLEQKRRQQADKEAARVQKIVSQQTDGAATKQIGGLLEYTQRELERAAVQIESLQKEVRQLEAENRRLGAENQRLKAGNV